MHTVSVIIPHYGDAARLSSCLAAVRSAGGSPEILVVDNSRNPAAARAAKAHGARLLVPETNLGYGPACNLAAKEANGTLLVFLNNDALPRPGWLPPLVQALARNPNAAAAGPKLLFAHDPSVINSAGGEILYHGAGKDRGRGKADSPAFDISGPCDYVSGAAMMVHKETFFAAGGFDPRFFLYNEDVDLCWRFARMGKTIQYVSASVVFHAESATTGKGATPQKIFFHTKNSFLTAVKNHPKRHLPPAIALHSGYNLLKIMAFAITARPARASALARALAEGWKEAFLGERLF
ncbi:MAG: glycosyltransferase family 2 protein [Deltaproteobacteria bacterium]|nr:glycosyltransferase family 2 protein [Deltaproteobacteria bacterium]